MLSLSRDVLQICSVFLNQNDFFQFCCCRYISEQLHSYQQIRSQMQTLKWVGDSHFMGFENPIVGCLQVLYTRANTKIYFNTILQPFQDTNSAFAHLFQSLAISSLQLQRIQVYSDNEHRFYVDTILVTPNFPVSHEFSIKIV